MTDDAERGRGTRAPKGAGTPNPRGAKTAQQQGSEGTFDQGGRSRVAPEPVRDKEPRGTPEAARETRDDA